MLKWSTLGLLAALMAAPGGVTPAVAQDAGPRSPVGRYSGTVSGGWTQYDGAAGIQDAPFAGFQVMYNLNRMVSFGPYLSAARPTTDETYFPFVRLEFGDTVFSYLLNQQLTTFDMGLAASVGLPVGPVVIEGLGGIGAYTVRLDPQRANRPVVIGTEVSGFSGMQYTLGGGLKLPVAGGALRVQARDVVYTDFERDLLSLADPLLSGTAIPHPNPDVPDAETTIHNLRYEIGFNFHLGGGR